MAQDGSNVATLPPPEGMTVEQAIQQAMNEHLAGEIDGVVILSTTLDGRLRIHSSDMEVMEVHWLLSLAKHVTITDSEA